MVDGASGAVSPEELRKHWLEHDLYKHQRILARLEAPKSPEYPIPIRLKDATLKLRFRSFNHGELMLLAMLPFYARMMAREELTTTEQETLLALKEKMTDLVALDLNQWREVSTKHPETIPQVFDILFSLSNLTEDEFKQLEDFLSSDFGFYYGLVWFGKEGMHRTPSEVGLLPESDYQTITLWLAKWMQRAGGAQRQ